MSLLSLLPGPFQATPVSSCSDCRPLLVFESGPTRYRSNGYKATETFAVGTCCGVGELQVGEHVPAQPGLPGPGAPPGAARPRPAPAAAPGQQMPGL